LSEQGKEITKVLGKLAMKEKEVEKEGKGKGKGKGEKKVEGNG